MLLNVSTYIYTLLCADLDNKIWDSHKSEHITIIVSTHSQANCKHLGGKDPTHSQTCSISMFTNDVDNLVDDQIYLFL